MTAGQRFNSRDRHKLSLGSSLSVTDKGEHRTWQQLFWKGTRFQPLFLATLSEGTGFATSHSVRQPQEIYLSPPPTQSVSITSLLLQNLIEKGLMVQQEVGVEASTKMRFHKMWPSFTIQTNTFQTWSRFISVSHSGCNPVHTDLKVSITELNGISFLVNMYWITLHAILACWMFKKKSNGRFDNFRSLQSSSSQTKQYS